jgi:hypothetical protein
MRAQVPFPKSQHRSCENFVYTQHRLVLYGPPPLLYHKALRWRSLFKKRAAENFILQSALEFNEVLG